MIILWVNIRVRLPHARVHGGRAIENCSKFSLLFQITSAQQFRHNYILNLSVVWNLHFQILTILRQQVQIKS